MQKVMWESLWVCLASGSVAMALGAVQGLPNLATSAEGAGSCAAPVPEEPSVAWIDADAAHAALNQPGFWSVDARSREAFVRGHMTGALSLPLAQATAATETTPPAATTTSQGPGLAAYLPLFASANTVVVYCDTHADCADSTQLAQRLASAGVVGVRVLEGGFPEWLRRGYPAESGPCRLCPSP